MTMQAKPPPDAPAPPPSDVALLSQRKWSWILGIGVGSILLLLLSGFLAPLVLRSRKKSNQTEAVNNARQIGLALFEFQTEYGKYPDDSTIAAVQAKTGTDLDLGKKSSNEFFRQLMASGIPLSESMFYAKIDGTRKPDWVFTKGEALKNGECGFTYFLGAEVTDSSRRPLVVTPMIPGTDRFDRTRFDGKAVILRMDQSVLSYPIDKGGHVMIDGRNLMDPHHPIWDGHPPVIAWPE